MRITSQDEMIDVNYDMCTLWVGDKDGEGKWKIYANTGFYGLYTLGEFPTKTAAVQELTRIYESWDRGCSNHQVRKAEG